jgi:predicted 2-oxoglutarate/Fe(II)-dependent dioxygenase YbiX/peroxiredoxin
MQTDPSAPPGAIQYKPLSPGDPFPDLAPACDDLRSFVLKAFAGRFQLYAFFLSADSAEVRAKVDALASRRDVFDDRRCSFIGVSVTPADRGARGLREALPGIHFAWDFDFRLAQQCGAIPVNAQPDQPTPVQRRWVIVDPSMRVMQVLPMDAVGADEILARLAALPTDPNRYGGIIRPAPVLIIPNVFETELCEQLIALYRSSGGSESGVYRGGEGVHDRAFKVRRDHLLTDRALIEQLGRRLLRRVVPDIEKLFFAQMKYVERHIVGCYSQEDGGHFQPHIDNGAGLTEHRRFAISVNLNGGFDGGEVVFPEYNNDGYKAPPGWAVVFPCAILHAVRPVTRGARYAYLPFLYDDAGRAIRKRELTRAGFPETDDVS